MRLIKRKLPTILLKKSICVNKKPTIDIERIEDGLKIFFSGLGKDLKSSKILLDLKTNNRIYEENISLANGMFHPNLNQTDCYSLEQNVPINLNKKEEDKFNKLDIDIIFINSLGEILLEDKKILKNDVRNLHQSFLMANKIEKVKQLGVNLKVGAFDELFKLVEILNQSDPKQIYLKDAEEIYGIRYGMNQQEDDIYSVLISQILQRKIKEAQNTTNIIINNHRNLNPNIYISKAVINLYLLNIKEARSSINNAQRLSHLINNDDIIKNIDDIINILEFKFI